MRYNTKLEEELGKKNNQSDDVRVDSVLALFLKNSGFYDVVSFSEFSLRQPGASATQYPIYANRQFRVGVGEIDRTQNTVTYGFIRENSDLVTSVTVRCDPKELSEAKR